MAYRSIDLEITQEHFERSIKGTPREAIKELIWNACDADAKNIEVSFVYEGLKGAEVVSDIYIKDDGHGIPFERVEEYFGKYGRSQKTYSHKSPAGRVYHGKLGQGRYKSLTAGNFVDWQTVFQNKAGELRLYEIQISADSQIIRFSEGDEVTDKDQTGTTVHIHGIPDDKINAVTKMSEPSEMVPELLETFAPYLLAYTDISIKYNGATIDPSQQIKKQGEKELVFEEKGKPPIKARAVAITWKEAQFNKLYICGSSGVVFAEEKYALLSRASTSLYLMGDLFEKLHRKNLLAMAAADPAYACLYEEAKKFVKEFVGEQAAEDAAAEIDRIKKEGVYPFDGKPQDAVAKAEREVFDVLAVEVNRVVPQLKSSPSQTKKLTYRLLRETINTNPSSIKTILEEVFNLTKEQQDDLAELLTHTHLPEIIDVAKTVSDRLSFLHLLDQMIYNDPVGKSVKERTQFHKILLKELWIFGEKYKLGTSDQSLKNLLKAHIKKLGRDNLIPDIPPEAVEDLTRIPDICLFEQFCTNYTDFEHLVIELKRPTLKLTLKELDQIRDYALTVAKNPLFDKAHTKWHFILLGKDLNDDVSSYLENQTVGEGNYYNAGNVSISVLKWSSVIQENKLKLEFLREKLDHRLDDDSNFATDYLRTRYAALFPPEEKEAPLNAPSKKKTVGSSRHRKYARH